MEQELILINNIEPGEEIQSVVVTSLSGPNGDKVTKTRTIEIPASKHSEFVDDLNGLINTANEVRKEDLIAQLEAQKQSIEDKLDELNG